MVGLVATTRSSACSVLANFLMVSSLVTERARASF